jgi:hypothetical protein
LTAELSLEHPPKTRSVAIATTMTPPIRTFIADLQRRKRRFVQAADSRPAARIPHRKPANKVRDRNNWLRLR